MKVKVSNIAFSKNEYLVECLLKEFPDAEVNTKGIRMNGDALVDYFTKTEAAIVGLELITPSLLEQLPELRMIAKYGVGLDNIDLKACAERNVEIGYRVKSAYAGIESQTNLYIFSRYLDFGQAVHKSVHRSYSY